MPTPMLSTPNWHCANFLRYVRSVRKKLTGWKQGHTPAEFSEPLPSAGVLFWQQEEPCWVYLLSIREEGVPGVFCGRARK